MSDDIIFVSDEARKIFNEILVAETLEAETLDLARAGSSSPVRWDQMTDSLQENWRSVALRAREIHRQPSRAEIARTVLEHWPQEYIDPRYPAAFRCAAAGCEWHGRFAGDIAEHVADLLTTGRET